MKTRLHNKGLYISYLIRLIGVDKCTSVTNDNFDVSFLAPGAHGAHICVICCWGRGGYQGLMEGTEGQGELNSMKKIGGIKSGGGSSSLFVVVGGAVVRKGKNCNFPL